MGPLLSTGKILYSILCVIQLPLSLILWAKSLDNGVAMPAIEAALPGLALLLEGAAMIVAGIAALYRHGNGLPMNAYPPKKYVTNGIYRFLSHPMYVGACLISIGVSITQGSAAGLWLISPALMLGCAALVLGYENEDLKRRFGDSLIQSVSSSSTES